jgi:hypothetical protein
MKTVNDWLNEHLTEEEMKKANRYKFKQFKKPAKSAHEALAIAFVWKTTIQGHEYWSKIHSRLKYIRGCSS